VLNLLFSFFLRKTNIIQRFTKDIFMVDSKTTIGVEFANKNVIIKNKKINLNIWDTAGKRITILFFF